MSGNITFTMIKPDAYAAGNASKILDLITSNGFKILALKQVHLSALQAAEFYEMHKEKSFFDALVEFMSSGKILAAILEKENAVNEFREFIGKTNPAEAAEGSLRKLFGTSLTCNAVHGSDSDESAEREANFFFSGMERL